MAEQYGTKKSVLLHFLAFDLLILSTFEDQFSVQGQLDWYCPDQFTNRKK